MTTPTDKPAFPLHQRYDSTGTFLIAGANGMTLREYYAGKALTTINLEDFNGSDWAEMVAKQCFQVADAMLAESQKRLGEQ